MPKITNWKLLKALTLLIVLGFVLGQSTAVAQCPPVQVFDGPGENYFLGISNDWVGDVNKDGIDDMIMGAFGARDDLGDRHGRAYVHPRADGRAI